MKYLCLDPGLKHTGVAISYEGLIAEPLTTIEAHNLNQLLSLLTKLVEIECPDVLVIGQPGSGPLHQFSLDLQAQLTMACSCKIVLYPEDLSSREASRRLVESGAAKKHRQRSTHQTAAAVVLQEYLDSH